MIIDLLIKINPFKKGMEINVVQYGTTFRCFIHFQTLRFIENASPMTSSDFSVDLILPAALWRGVDSSR
jgi:hypothetical protein